MCPDFLFMDCNAPLNCLIEVSKTLKNGNIKLKKRLRIHWIQIPLMLWIDAFSLRSHPSRIAQELKIVLTEEWYISQAVLNNLVESMHSSCQMRICYARISHFLQSDLYVLIPTRKIIFRDFRACSKEQIFFSSFISRYFV
ncbi:hypothetical protein NPIL_456311 [Nephila pilipes]|uniref:Uncharacterized protein n=1 Tax=Nephila pilipes TaxID=299642 RepID=A0A8X6PDS3_NEPPI|nr:hypothetical protein NPIL_456311 [Nephila pilipes]